MSRPHAVLDAGDKKYAYDKNGNMTGWTSKTTNASRLITWNEENRVKNIADSGNGTSFLYNDQGERVVKGGGGNETVYLNRFYSLKNGGLGSKHIFAGETRVCTKLEKDGGSIQSGVPGANALIVSQGLQNAILQGNGQKRGINRRLVSSGTGTTTTTNPPIEKFEFFYHGDHLGSSSFITDDAGAVYQHLEYFPYGETWVEDGGSGQMPYYRFTGKELDPETGLYYYGARYYDPVLSRWISADPALGKYLQRASGNRQGNTVYQPITLSLYAYAGLNPLKYIDPTGEELRYLIIGGADLLTGEGIFTGTGSYPMWDAKVIKEVSVIVTEAKVASIPLRIGSGYRTYLQQQKFYNAWLSKQIAQQNALTKAYKEWFNSGMYGPLYEPSVTADIMPNVNPAARPEVGPHSAGFAMDTNWAELGILGERDNVDYQGKLKEIMSKHGFYQVSDPREVHHFQADPTNHGYSNWQDAVSQNRDSFNQFELDKELK